MPFNSIVSEEDQVAKVTLLNPYNAKNFKKDKLSSWISKQKAWMENDLTLKYKSVTKPIIIKEPRENIEEIRRGLH